MRKGAVCILILALAPGSAMAADAPSADKTAKPAKATDEGAKSQEALVCTKEQMTGSVIVRKVCRPQSQVEQDRKEVQRINEERQRAGSARARPGEH